MRDSRVARDVLNADKGQHLVRLSLTIAHLCTPACVAIIRVISDALLHRVGITPHASPSIYIHCMHARGIEHAYTSLGMRHVY